MLTLADIVDRRARNPAPGPRGHPLLGSLPEVRRDPLRLFLAAFREYGEVVRFHFGPMVAHLVSSPAGVHHVLAENNRNYGKQTRGYKNLRYVLGNGLLTSEGEAWKRQRRIAQPAFHRQRIAGFGETMVRAAEDASSSLEARRGQAVDLHQEMMRLTLRIVGETLLGYDPTDAADEVGAALAFLLNIANERSARIFDIPPLIPTRENLRFRRALATLDRVVLRMIAERRKDPGERGDLLSMLIEARDAETGEAMDDRQLRDQAMTIFLAGHETTANALTFSWLLLSRFPAVYRELRAELLAVLGGRSPTVDDLPRLALPRRVLQEAMRLYPPAWIIGRSANDADEIGGYGIPARSIVFISPYVIHRHPGLWENPEGFDPARFEKEPQRGSYLPFGGGPRMCIGNGFATMEGELVLATLAQRLRFDLVPGEPVELEPSITLRPRRGVHMTVVGCAQHPIS
jgi:cytochrome P450